MKKYIDKIELGEKGVRHTAASISMQMTNLNADD